MKKFFVSALLELLLFTTVLSYRFNGDNNLLLEDPSLSPENTCDVWTERFAKNQRTVVAKLPPDVHGKWVSESCEVRPGPEFLIRKYHFHRNNTFTTQQFFYSDESCTSPTYSVTADGKYRFKSPSWVVPGGMNAEYLLTKVTITPYNNHVSQSLSHKVNRSCPGSVKKSWRPYKSYKVYSYIEVLKGEGKDKTVQVLEDMDCISGLHVVLHELQLFRVEHRKALHRHHRRSGHHIPSHGIRNELYLGDIHTEVAQRTFYHPTSYQPPLLRPETSGCHVCHLVAKSNEHSPPQLHAKVKLPVYISGVWISNICETRPYGMFITRQLSFFGYNQTWKGEYQYFTDAKCSTKSFKITAKGRYRPGNPSAIVQGGTEYNFYIKEAKILPQSTAMVNNLNGHRYNACGHRGKWKLKVKQDVTWTNGCLGLGLKVPATEYDLVRMEIDHNGNTMLHLGHVDTDFKRQRLHESHKGHHHLKRPTSYQTPLVQCKSYPSYADHIQNAIYPEPYQYNSNIESSATTFTYSFALCVFTLVLKFAVF